MTAAAAENQNEGGFIPWWLVLLEGIALIIMGILLIINPGKSMLIVVQFLGIYWLVAGMFKIISIFIDSSQWLWKLIAGIIGILAGIVVLQHPLWSTLAVETVTVVLLGFAGVIIGLISIYQAFKGAGWGTGILGVISVLLGLVLLANRWVFTISLPWVLGIFAIVGGIAAIWGAFRIRRETKEMEEAAARTDSLEAETAPMAAAAEPMMAEEAAEPEDEEGVADLSEISHIGPVNAETLQSHGVDSPEALLERGATRKGREELAAATGFSHQEILTWVNHVDLMRIRGVGTKYADLLEAAGVDTVPELAQRNPENLRRTIKEFNDENKLVLQTPALSQVQRWVAQAKELPRVITY